MKQKIEVASVPTVADLRTRRLERMQGKLREQILARNFDDVRVVVESLAEEFDVMEIAAAAVRMAQPATGPDVPDREAPDVGTGEKTFRPARARDRFPGKGGPSRGKPWDRTVRAGGKKFGPGSRKA
ncbi:MAG TPA: hypothetical protein VGS98_14925 [Thermoanaerobaculia bacterium]|jgi:ATP-dependent RNA helicase DeaD|nr:hypothetical protein [Thermoanaerobaculia bacterium]